MKLDYFDVRKLIEEEGIYNNDIPYIASGIIELDRIFLPSIGIHEFLMYPNSHCEDLILHYATTLASSFPVLIIDPIRHTSDSKLLQSLPDRIKRNITILQNSFKQSIEKEIYDAVAGYDALVGVFILNAAALISENEFNMPPQAFDRAGFSRFMMGLYRWLSSRIPFVFVSNIAWSRKLAKKVKKDSPGGDFRKTMIKSLYKVEKVSSVASLHIDIINVYTQDRPTEGIKIAYDLVDNMFVSMEAARLLGYDKTPRKMLVKINALLRRIAGEATFDSIVNNKSLAKFITAGA